MKKFWIKKGVMILFFGIAAIALFGLLVMALWNAVLPAVLGVKAISFLQALGILLLSKLLFGGFGRGWKSSKHRNGRWMDMKEKFAGMTPEEKEKFKAEWRNRCGSRWAMGSTRAESAAEATPGEV
jgi:Ca2+/H+ antiporter, TMEM165/GDT1 family